MECGGSPLFPSMHLCYDVDQPLQELQNKHTKKMPYYQDLKSIKVLQYDVPQKTCHLIFFIFCMNHHLGVLYNTYKFHRQFLDIQGK